MRGAGFELTSAESLLHDTNTTALLCHLLLSYYKYKYWSKHLFVSQHLMIVMWPKLRMNTPRPLRIKNMFGFIISKMNIAQTSLYHIVLLIGISWIFIM